MSRYPDTASIVTDSIAKPYQTPMRSCVLMGAGYKDVMIGYREMPDGPEMECSVTLQYNQIQRAALYQRSGLRS